MTIELILFVSLILLAIVYFSTNAKFVFFIYIIVMSGFLIAIRVNPQGEDFVTYYEYLRNVQGIRYYREIVYFSIGLFLFEILQDEITTFIAMDAIWILAILRIQYLINLESKAKDYGLIMILFTSFPLFFGYENVYRQLFAEIFSLYAFIVRKKSPKTSLVLLVTAILMHNTAIIIIPLLTIQRFWKFDFKIRVLGSTIIAIVFCFLLAKASGYKSGHETGLNLRFAYFGLFASMFLFFLFRKKFHLTNFIKEYPSLYITTFLMTGLITLKVSAVAERMGMFFLVFLMTDFYIESERYPPNKRRLFRIWLLLFFSVPVIVFSSSRDYISY